MYRMENFRYEKPNPSFSSTLLDEIYRSIDEGDGELKLCKTTMANEQSKAILNRRYQTLEDEEIWKVRTKELYRKSKHDYDPDVMFFSSNSNSNSNSSESSSGALSSSDTESLYGVASKTSCFAPRRPKPIKTTATAARSERTENSLFHDSAVTEENRIHNDGLIKSKSRALKIYSNLKKVKQPISPGGKVASFLNSLFAAGNTKKSKNLTTKSGQVSTCSSASSFSRSCLSKSSPSTREKLRNEVKRTVRFYEDLHPYGHKCLYEQQESNLLPVSIPKAWKIGKSPSNKLQQEPKTRRAEESAMDFLKDYLQSQKKDLNRYNDDNDDNNDYDDGVSCSSSDLFELDHLAVMSEGLYDHEELPVYETTHVRTNRAIAKGLFI